MNLGQLISFYCAENNISMAQFAMKSGISRPYLFVLKNESRSAGLQTYQKAAKAMGMSYEELIGKLELKSSIVAKDDVCKEIPLYDELPLRKDNNIGTVGIIAKKGDGLFAYKYTDRITLIVNPKGHITNDSIVLVKANGEIVMRRYIKEGKSTCLVPLDANESTILMDGNESRAGMVVFGEIVEMRTTFK